MTRAIKFQSGKYSAVFGSRLVFGEKQKRRS